MRILIVTPAPPGSRVGNRVSALRWAKLLRELGHRVTVATSYHGQRSDLLLALHAGKSADTVRRFHQDYPDALIILALTGTDLYEAIHKDPIATGSLELATRFIVLQSEGIKELPRRFRAKARVVHQSVTAPASLRGRFREPSATGRGPSRRAGPTSTHFDVCVLGHLRTVKDPFRTAEATRLLPDSSRIRVLHVGKALHPDMAKQAQLEMAANKRYRWLGELPRARALRVLQRCHLLSLTSVMEGGANAISEAVVLGVPVISSDIAGSIGLLGSDYPGYFHVGDTAALAQLLERAETDQAFLRDLRSRGQRLKKLFHPDQERRSLKELLAELV